MSKRATTIYYILVDLLSAGLAWSYFNYYRKTNIDVVKTGNFQGEIFDSQFFISIVLLPIVWVLVYYLSGSYNNVLRKSRINEFVQTLATSIIGVTVIFFVLLLDDSVASYRQYYRMYFVLFSCHFVLTSIGRLLLSSRLTTKFINANLVLEPL